MSDQTIEGEVTDGGPEAPSQTAKEIFDAEVKALEASEAGGSERASDYFRVETHGGGSEAETEDTGGEQLSEGDELETEEEGQESEESPDDSKPKRHDWKKEALESRQALESIKAEIAELKQAIRKPDPTKEESKIEIETPKIDLENPELSQELKELLEYTPGLDKLVTSLAADTTKAIIEKAEADRTAREQEQQTARQREEADKQYWSSMDQWFQGQYPDLSLSEVRNSPDFVDWMTYHKTWVDTQLSSTDYDDISGAQKVFDRYVQDKGLVDQEPEQGKRSLAAARTPATNRRSAPPAPDRRSLFQQEAERLNSKKPRFQTTI